MKKELVNELNRIIDEKRITIVFQPIVSLQQGEVIGFEALSRAASAFELANPENLFCFAAELGRQEELERLCRSLALSAFGNDRELSASERLFLNVSPGMISSESFCRGFTQEFLLQYGIRPEQIVLEITERQHLQKPGIFKKNIERLKKRKIQIALDDAGTMYSGLMMISETEPNFVKLDRCLIQGLAAGNINFALVGGMMETCRLTNSRLIAEGVETISELNSLIELGVPFAQGFLLKKPALQPGLIDEKIRDLIASHTAKSVTNSEGSSIKQLIARITTQTEIIPKEMKVEQVFDKFQANPDTIGFCVVDAGRVIGIVTKVHLMLELSGRYGFSLHQNRPISELMDRCFISVDYQTPISAVSKLAMARSQERLYDFIVVTKSEQYLGTVTIKNLLKRATEIEVVKARFENPLTGLPGNRVIDRKMTELIQAGRAKGVVYLDINHFKEYNDVYGFEKGDEIIKLLADILIAHLPLGNFVGHVGGDDFVAILNQEKTDDYCRKTSEEFREKIRPYYTIKDLNNGYIMAENRRGTAEQFPLVSVSVAGIFLEKGTFSSVQELTSHLAYLKKKSKQQVKNHYLLIDLPGGNCALPGQ